MAHILLVEDEEGIALGLRMNLELEGYTCSHAADGLSGLAAIRQGGADLVLLDVMLPGMDGFEICRQVRQEGNRVPILFLTAKSLEEDRVQGLEAGGDDYMPKPLSIKELVARIESMLRRQRWYDQSIQKNATGSFGGNTVDFDAYSATTWTGEQVHLTQKECMLLRLLVENEGRVVDRTEILDSIWGTDKYPSTRTVDNLVLHLRKYFEREPTEPRHFLSVYRVGYRFVADPTDSPA
ncbi:MAG: response regulator transcription factor [Calditrichaeota bacterium]|nr:response regulator transcription factor [Candidatus Cloacimonadota bacterium]MCA9785041.1 response regulator transcription factor [Candidatus Cloacimonadota bacterium]MCB1046809.1 response regulator transcription factor [Calditrichota bacterium]MCB9474950.1 response regulator transcription factor [Candidatus Delongbacteria bacterium]